MTKKKNDSEQLSYITRRNIKRFINQTQSVQLNSQKIDLPSLKIRKKALDLITARLNQFIEEQIVNLKLDLPRFGSGEKQNQIKLKTITEKAIEGTNFPNLKKPSPQSFKDSIVDLFN